MPATPARIAFVTQAARSVVWTDAAVKTRYGAAARDTKDEPVETFFDSTADAQTYANQRGALLGGNARRFLVTVTGILSFTGALDYSQSLPGVKIVDDEKLANLNAVITGVPSLDYQTGRTTLACWGLA